ncbi:S-methyl-5-thioribose-1-phosphate isomerase [Streptomyces sp. NPDC088354]|uniref:S-methyl-5-thioribose-1-phosphate isomerase n=1 Tax=unclassified Streptomyces TaxID=2593676 RepID=UPI0029A9A511|nr:S-methyl-5-thioribose-1-phosphate isomerase [Streptomyces sp. MI02-7b]MDX3078255.1 S-methyl-5-thioribose-1-phosphate isomerase [Streptomyces sp. MI02-7b]
MGDQYVVSLANETKGNPDEPLPALRWEEPPEGPVLVLLDQTRLPAEEVELVCTDVPALVEAIRGLAVRGAPLLGIAGAYGVALAAVRGYDVDDAAETLAHARPTAVNLAYGVKRAVAAYRAALTGEAHGDPDRAAAAALAEARRLHAEDAEASTAMGRNGLQLLSELLPGGGYQILTHCNSGALVSGGEGTAFAVALAAHRRGQLRRLWVDETRPLLQGARLTAYEAARTGMAYTLLTDNAAGSLFAAGEVHAVLVGADRIAADGSVANKVGTYPLAVLARYHNVPFVVVAPTTTVDLDTPDGASVEIEQRPGHEVTDAAGVAMAPLGTQAYNPAFDITPPGLITAMVTENGVISPVTADALAALCSPRAPGHDQARG